MKPRLRILLYCQHLSGTGHFVRSWEIARAAVRAGHDALIVDGGPVVPRPASADAPRLLSLPRLCRQGGQVAAMQRDADLGGVMDLRAGLLRRCIDDWRPDVLVVEHFPFSKWELAGEILPLVGRARACGSRVVCSRRDIVAPSRLDEPEAEHASRALEILHGCFDAVLVHGAAALTPMSRHTAWADRIRIPVHHTGIVSQKPLGESGRAVAPPVERPFVLVSGGGAGDGSIAAACARAWAEFPEHPVCRDHALVNVRSPFATLDAGIVERAGAGVVWTPFSLSFVDWMSSAAASVSHAGYNTCANILETRCRAVVVPREGMSDQGPRAEALSRAGLVRSMAPTEASGGALLAELEGAIRGPRPAHGIDLGGADHTVGLLEAIASPAQPLIQRRG